MKSLIKPLIISALLIASCTQHSKAANTNTEELNGTWNIVQNGSIIDAIDINLSVSSKNFSRFDFSQNGQTGTNESAYQGILFDDYVVFNLINLGQTQTYIAKVDFELGGGPGIKIASKLADCNTIGQANGQVDKKNRKRLATSSARCDGSKLNDSTTTNIKLVKAGVDASSIPNAGSADPELVADQEKIDTRLRGVWAAVPGGKASNKKILIKEPIADYFGYQFTYKIVNNSTKLIQLSADDFITGTRKGYFIDNYMILNTSTFHKPDELFVFKLTKTTGSGREFKITNGDCFQLKNPVSGTLVCTPNQDSEVITNTMTRFDGSKISKSNTNIIINF